MDALLVPIEFGKLVARAGQASVKRLTINVRADTSSRMKISKYLSEKNVNQNLNVLPCKAADCK
jgi:hypothetical protein